MNFAKFLRTPFLTEDLWMTASEFGSEILIFRNSRSQMFFKISVLKNFAILEPLSDNKVADLFYRTTTVAASEFLWLQMHFCSMNMVFIADSRAGFCSGLL